MTFRLDQDSISLFFRKSLSGIAAPGPTEKKDQLGIICPQRNHYRVSPPPSLHRTKNQNNESHPETLKQPGNHLTRTHEHNTKNNSWLKSQKQMNQTLKTIRHPNKTISQKQEQNISNRNPLTRQTKTAKSKNTGKAANKPTDSKSLNEHGITIEITKTAEH